MKHYFDICEYGACPDGKTMNTSAIQKAIDECHQAGGGKVLCGPGSFLTGSLVLKSNVELCLAAGCKIVGSTSLDDYEDFVATGFRGENAPEQSTKSLIRAIEAENIAITGSGEINGSGLAFYDTRKCTGRFSRPGEARRDVRAGHPEERPAPCNPRPRIVMFYKCRRIRFEETSFADSPSWTFWLMKCEEVSIHRVKIRGDRRMQNNDGIDLDACREVTVSDSIIQTDDDCLVLRAIQGVYDTPAVCENVTVSNCILDSCCNGIRIGCPDDGVIRHCTFTNLVIHSACNGILFENPKRYLSENSCGSADIHDILFSHIIVDCAHAPIKIIVEDGIKLRRLAGLSFSDFRIRSGDACRVQGSPETIIRNVSFSNIEIETSGEDAIICRHCRGVKLAHVELSNRSEPLEEPR